MPINDLSPISLDVIGTRTAAAPVPWLWDGYLRPGAVTLLTSQWKTGKTTLLTGLFRHLATGEPFLGRAVKPGRAWIVSEESPDQWGERMRLMPVGEHVLLLSRPFLGRPTFDDWHLLIEMAHTARYHGRLDLFVVDPLASFLPGRSESEPTTVLESLHTLHRLTTAGVAVLLLLHPRRQAAAIGCNARGGGAMLGFMDVTIELTRYSRLDSDAHRRMIRAQSRRTETPARLAYEWNEATGEFRAITDPRERQFEENWQTVQVVLKAHETALTHKEIRERWPADVERPNESTLYDWLNLAHTKKLIRRQGRGNSKNPYRYRLENEDDQYYDRGELPPLRGFFNE